MSSSPPLQFPALIELQRQLALERSNLPVVAESMEPEPEPELYLQLPPATIAVEFVDLPTAAKRSWQ